MTDKTPAQVEADEDETITVEWDGIPVTVPASAEALDLDALEALENGKGITFMRHLVGTKRFDEVRRQWEKENGRKPAARDVAPFMEAAAEALGFASSGN